jgi:hypothetical protein
MGPFVFPFWFNTLEGSLESSSTCKQEALTVSFCIKAVDAKHLTEESYQIQLYVFDSRVVHF